MLMLLLFLAGCAGRAPVPPPTPTPVRVNLLGHTIQAGAFSVLDNAVRLTESLQQKGQPATFFKDNDGLFKVRFGDFPTGDAARRYADLLLRQGTIDAYYIVAPGKQAAAQRQQRGDAFVRSRLVETAKGFLGLPYRWGGASTKTGFDCSGLTMTTYRLNGYRLPRTSGEQFRTGTSVSKTAISRGDLVFFAIQRGKKVSHVGVYIGNGRFIHAPRRGKTIRISSLESDYYRRHFVGARSYL